MIKYVLTLFLMLTAFCLYAQESAFERKLGDQQFEVIKNTQGFYENENLHALIASVGKRLEKHIEDSTLRFSYYIIDTDIPNAFATSGGYVYVTRGLLALLDNEDELACALAHEISHVTEHHTKKRVHRNILPIVIEIPGKLIGELWVEEAGEIINFPVEFFSKTVNSSFDRKQEKQADAKGIEVATKAGYNPNALMSMLQKLQNETDLLTGQKAKRGIFNDHPMTEDRLMWIDKKVSNMGAEFDEPRSVVSVLDGMLIGQNPEQGILTKDNYFFHPKLSIAMQLPTEWEIENIPIALTAKAPENDAVMIVGMENEYSTIEEASEAYVEKVKQDKKLSLKQLDSIPINVYKSREVVTVQKRGSHEILSLSLWIQLSHKGQILQLVGSASDEKGLEQIVSAISTLRPLSSNERAQIKEQVIRVENGQDESLSAFAGRKDNTDFLPFLEVINNMQQDQNVKGKMVKYITSIPYAGR